MRIARRTIFFFAWPLSDSRFYRDMKQQDLPVLYPHASNCLAAYDDKTNLHSAPANHPPGLLSSKPPQMPDMVQPVIEMLSMAARGSIPIRTDDSIRAGYYPRTGRILPVDV